MILQQLDCSDFNHTIFENAVTAELLFGKALSGFADVVSEWEGFEHYGPHLEALKSNYLSKVLKTYKPNRNEFGFNVLNHADFHVRNVLFKKDDFGKMEDFKFVSFSCLYSIRLQFQLFHRLIIKFATTQLQPSI